MTSPRPDARDFASLLLHLIRTAGQTARTLLDLAETELRRGNITGAQELARKVREAQREMLHSIEEAGERGIAIGGLAEEARGVRSRLRDFEGRLPAC